jgi:hypothetical protein
MGLTGTGITDKDNIASGVNKLTGTTVINGSLVNRGLKGKIEILY